MGSSSARKNSVPVSATVPSTTRRRAAASLKSGMVRGMQHASFGSHLQPAFVQVDKFKHRLYRAGRQADLGETLIQALRAGVAPAALGHERIPHFDRLIIRLTTVLEG